MAKLTDKQEKFVQKYIECGNQSESYRHAYNAKNMKPATVNRAAKEVYDNPNVAARIKELQAQARKRHDLTIDDLIAELEEAREFARECRQSGTFVTATMGKAKLLGLDKEHLSADEAATPAKVQIEITDARKR